MKRHRYIATLLLLFIGAIAIAQNKTTKTHTVAQGQTLFSISKIYGITVDDIISHNPGCSNKLSIGQKLIIPADKTQANTPNDNNADGTLRHTIKSKETLFQLGQLYGVTPDEICAANPGLSISNFQVGKTIIIPRPEAKNTPATQDIQQKQDLPEIATTHKVRWRETIEKICKKYEISEEDFLAVNPQLESRKLKRKTIVNIPAKREHTNTPAEQEQEEQQAPSIVEEQEPPKNNKKDDGTTEVAVILPFLLDRFAPNEQTLMVEFYQGFLMAVEQLKREGHSFVINTFDSGFKDKSLDSLINSGSLNKADLIIGAYYPKHNKELARFAETSNTPLIIPFSNKETELFSNPQVFFVNTVQSHIMPDISRNFAATFPNANVVFVEDSIKSEKPEFIKAMTVTLDSDSIPYSIIPIEKITIDHYEEPDSLMSAIRNLAVDSRETIFIPTSSSRETFSRILPGLVMASAIDTALMSNYKLFGYPEWQVYAQQAREQLYEVDTYFYSTFFSHYSMPDAAQFHNEYIRWFNSDLQKIYPRRGMLGYDIGYLFLLAASRYGEEFPEKINEVEYSPIQTGFKFERINGSGAFMNKKLYFIHYNRDYNIEKIDLDKCER